MGTTIKTEQGVTTRQSKSVSNQVCRGSRWNNQKVRNKFKNQFLIKYVVVGGAYDKGGAGRRHVTKQKRFKMYCKGTLGKYAQKLDPNVTYARNNWQIKYVVAQGRSSRQMEQILAT